MTTGVSENFFHDVRAPLARALTYGKLLGGARAEEREELLQALLRSLEDLELVLRSEEEKLE